MRDEMAQVNGISEKLETVLLRILMDYRGSRIITTRANAFTVHHGIMRPGNKAAEYSTPLAEQFSQPIVVYQAPVA